MVCSGCGQDGHNIRTCPAGKAPQPTAPSQPTEFYHGTSPQAALLIQENGFRVDLSGTNAGTMLGPGVYVTTTLQKAMRYAEDKPHGGVVLKLRVDLGNCRAIVRGDALRTTWQQAGYDSAWAARGVLRPDSLGENCVFESKRIAITDVIALETRQLQVGGFSVVRQGARGVLVQDAVAQLQDAMAKTSIISKLSTAQAAAPPKPKPKPKAKAKGKGKPAGKVDDRKVRLGDGRELQLYRDAAGTYGSLLWIPCVIRAVHP